jgi:hypothetical protein
LSNRVDISYAGLRPTMTVAEPTSRFLAIALISVLLGWLHDFSVLWSALDPNDMPICVHPRPNGWERMADMIGVHMFSVTDRVIPDSLPFLPTLFAFQFILLLLGIIKSLRGKRLSVMFLASPLSIGVIWGIWTQAFDEDFGFATLFSLDGPSPIAVTYFTSQALHSWIPLFGFLALLALAVLDRWTPRLLIGIASAALILASIDTGILLVLFEPGGPIKHWSEDRRIFWITDWFAPILLGTVGVVCFAVCTLMHTPPRWIGFLIVPCCAFVLPESIFYAPLAFRDGDFSEGFELAAQMADRLDVASMLLLLAWGCSSRNQRLGH